jgi:hypothetical protein
VYFFRTRKRTAFPVPPPISTIFNLLMFIRYTRLS